jgi:hypothetical protein
MNTDGNVPRIVHYPQKEITYARLSRLAH